MHLLASVPSWLGCLVEEVLHVEREFNVVNTREVDTSTWLGFFGMQSGAPTVNESVWDVGVMLIRFDKSEVASLFGSEAGQIVELEMYSPDWILQVPASVAAPVVDVVLTFSSHRPNELDDGVVEVEVHPDLR